MAKLSKKLLGIVWHTEGDSDSTPESQPTSNPILPRVAMPVPVAVPPVQGGQQILDVKYLENIMEVMKEANFPGPDYYELFHAVRELEQNESLKNLSLGQKIEIVFTPLKLQGLTLDAVMHSMASYLELIEKHRIEFRQTHIPQLNQVKVGELENENKHLRDANMLTDGQIKQLEEQATSAVSQLEAQISQLQQQVASVKQNLQVQVQGLRTQHTERDQKISLNTVQIEEQKKQLQTMEQKFETAYQYVLNWINTDKAEIEKMK